MYELVLVMAPGRREGRRDPGPQAHQAITRVRETTRST
jgi:hypothetical protein